MATNKKFDTFVRCLQIATYRLYVPFTTLKLHIIIKVKHIQIKKYLKNSREKITIKGQIYCSKNMDYFRDIWAVIKIEIEIILFEMGKPNIPTYKQTKINK